VFARTGVDNVGMASPATELRARVESLPGLGPLLPAFGELASPSYLVGGAVRDLLRGAHSVDLDVAVEGDAPAAARVLAERLGGAATEHERFGTATLRVGPLTVDLASTRREIYDRPGALPRVEPAPLEGDLGRRDFTVNAMAVALTGEDLGALHDPHDGRGDLEAGWIRVLHAGSFLDDPTRLFRALRYGARLGFELHPDTERLAREAAAGGTLQTVSGDRVRVELEQLLAEPEAPAAVDRMAELGLDRSLHPALVADSGLVASAQLGSVETGASRVLSALAALCVGGADGKPERLAGWVSGLGLAAGEREAVLTAMRRAPRLAGELSADMRPSKLHALLAGEPPETLAVALALGAPAEPILRYVADLQRVGLEITGADLLAAGIPESPALGRALRETLRRKLDGDLSGREEELRTALSIAREAR
jgi:tRNA nucleotidyltransferase (CCA-adding enzyme)